MPVRFATTCVCVYTAICRHFSTAAKLPRLPALSKIPYKHKLYAIEEAQTALTEYLHGTRSLPFTYAEYISRNSLFSLSDLISKVEFSPSTFSRSFQRFLRYHPVNEFEFFYESIGINYKEIDGLLPVNKFFLSENSKIFDAACVLAGFGFPWNKLGKLYKEQVSIFGKESCELSKTLGRYKDYGFNSISVIGICLAFPYVLSREWNFVAEIEALFDDLKMVFLDYGLINCVDGNVEAWYKVCEKIRLFYDLGCGKGKIGKLTSCSKDIFIDYSLEVLVEKIDFFCRLGVQKDEVGLLLLSSPEILNFDLENRIISVLGFLKHFGLNSIELKSVSRNYPYAFGRNKIVNMPHVLRLLNLHEWFFHMLRSGNHHLLGTYAIGSPDEDSDKDFTESLVRIQSSRTYAHTIGKLNFLHAIGFGENRLTAKALTYLHGSRTELQERFDCLLCSGIEFSRLCKMVSVTPKILNQQTEILEQKMKFIFQEMGSSLNQVDAFPAFLCYDLERRIKPRYRFHMWLAENGLCEKEYSLASIIATSEKNFVARISSIHPAATKTWFESFSRKNLISNCEEAPL